MKKIIVLMIIAPLLTLGTVNLELKEATQGFESQQILIAGDEDMDPVFG
ncbi:MAG: hypothetical protein JEZ08_04965 [Clostridiales bacterium]|nr:hypothetical protein [Clostridiales bacterium]